MKPFRGVIVHTADASTRMDTVTVAKGGEFTIVSDGECPWPPHGVLAENVVVMDVAEYRRLRDLAERAS